MKNTIYREFLIYHCKNDSSLIILLFIVKIAFNFSKKTNHSVTIFSTRVKKSLRLFRSIKKPSSKLNFSPVLPVLLNRLLFSIVLYLFSFSSLYVCVIDMISFKLRMKTSIFLERKREFFLCCPTWHGNELTFVCFPKHLKIVFFFVK